MNGRVAIEESFCLPRLEETERVTLRHFCYEDIDTHVELHCDITGVRLEQCDEFGIGLQVINYMSPGVQGEKDKATAEAFATEINEVGADRILFAVDYPFERNREGAPWFDNVEISQIDRLKS